MNQSPLTPRIIERIVDDMLDGSLHAKQCESIAHGVVGALYTDRAGVAAIGRASARHRGKIDKHGIKQYDRYLSNEKVRPQVFLPRIARRLLGARKELVAAIDWTEFAPDGHSTIAISMITRHGRAIPLVWMTVLTSKLKRRRARYEDEALWTLAQAVPDGTRVTILADRGFGDTGLYELLSQRIRFDFVVRFRGCIRVITSDGDDRPASERVPRNGRARRLDNVRLTGRKRPVAGVVLVRRAGMKDDWCLATSRPDAADEIVALYSKRFRIEETFRDQKDRRFGLGLYYTRVGDPRRRDRMLLVLVIAYVIATLLGAAGERVGLDRLLRANTAKTRTHSLFRQGCEYLRGVVERTLTPLRNAFFELVRDHVRNAETYAEI